MGIPGLTTYIHDHSDRYLRNYELHDTYLVIDGDNISCQIFNSYMDVKCNSAFGGDYDSYARAVSTFFDDLLKCRITPLVLIDGANEDKKLRTTIVRSKEKIQTASRFSLFGQENGSEIFPLLQDEVFRSVMIKKNIRHAQCLFEADNEIAAVAKILNCPVLSYDSDFYIYGSQYIPFNTLDTCVVSHSRGKGYVKRCKIYKAEYLLNSFRGLHESMLPLAAILLGNDYVERGTFTNFFRHMDIKKIPGRKYRESMITATFTWLSKYTLNTAITRILITLPEPSRRSMLNLIEDIINNYIKTSAEILIPLRFPTDYITRVKTQHLSRSFKFDGDISISTCIKQAYEGEKDEVRMEEDYDVFEVMSTINESLPQNEAISNLPEWFVNEYHLGKLPPYFIDLIVHRLYICPIQIENDDYPSSSIISLKIVSVIFGFLKSAINDEVRYMRYVIRDKNRIVIRELQCIETVNCCKLPSLTNLREIPLSLRREILNETLGINDADGINELPPEWRLYFGCIKYWIREQEPIVFHKSNVYAICIGMIFHIIDSKIGLYRTTDTFEKRNGQVIEAIKQKRANNYQPYYTTNGTVIEAYTAIDSEDCYLAASFFISHFGLDEKLLSDWKIFNKSIVHAFVEFQNCLRHAMNLNALLGCPYPQTIIATFFNGTLLYNLSNNFKTHQDIERHINAVLGMSPSHLKLFHILLSKVKLAKRKEFKCPKTTK